MGMKEEEGWGNDQERRKARCACAFPHVCIVIVLNWYSWGGSKRSSSLIYYCCFSGGRVSFPEIPS